MLSLAPLLSLLSTRAVAELSASTVLSNLLKALSLTNCMAADVNIVHLKDADRATVKFHRREASHLVCIIKGLKVAPEILQYT